MIQILPNWHNMEQLVVLFALILFGFAFALLHLEIAARKGKQRWLWFIFGFIPLVGFPFGSYWLASLPEKDIIKRIAKVEATIEKAKERARERREQKMPGVHG